MDLTAFYRLFKERTGVDLVAPVAPVDNQTLSAQTSTAGKSNVASVANERTFDREYKQQQKPPSLFLQAQRTMTGDTLLTRNNIR